MGAYWLNDLDQAIRSGGLEVVYYDNNWRTRSRSSGGYDGVWAIGYHHDAGNTSQSAQSAADWAWKNSSDRPIGAMRLDRDCRVWLGAAGATNTMGKGGPISTSRGTIPQDAGNKYMIAIEAGNNGVGEPWKKAMLDAYFALVGALCEWYDLDPNRDVYSHHWYCQPSCPGRKVDPAGPTPDYPDLGGTSGAKTWTVDAFRARVTGAPAPKPPEPQPEPPPDEDKGDYAWMASLPTIKKGQSGAYVERMQHLLAAAGYMNPANTANYDGVWGSGTENAKVNFDNDHGLTPSPPSDCGAKSWESLMTGKKW